MGRVKVIGYAQRVFYGDGIEYRNFSDGLVGQQFASSDNITFTNGNFIIDTNLDAGIGRIFKTNNFSKYYTHDTLNPNNNSIIQELSNNTELKLNLDKSQLRYYALFGSLREFIRTSLEKIIKDWPASLYVQKYLVTPFINNLTGNTVENYYYDIINNISTFTVNSNQIKNPYNIDYSLEGLTLSTFNNDYDLKNFTLNFNDYTINGERIIDYSGVSDTNFGTLYLKTSGNPFPNISGTSIESYHIKPSSEILETFFENLEPFEAYILNRLTLPKYKSVFTYNEVLDTGVVLTRNDTFIWPVTDGYNLDFNTPEYISFVSKLIEMADKSDGIDSNLITRFLTSDSISDFDSAPDCLGGEHETSGAKVNKTLKIYGREYDEILSFIDGISHAHTVSYDKKNNIPDNIVKLFGRSLGWELTSSLINNDILTSYLTRNDVGYSGYSRGLSISEQEIEFWRRLIINTPWIWKSKGTRKVIELFFKLIGTPEGLYKFNEYVYVVDKQLDIEPDLSYFNIDSDGYPKILRNTANMYFQKDGLWYRETGGENAVVDLNSGNNPHVGPYDGGQTYINQFRCLIPDFSSVTIHKEYTTSATTNLYFNDSAGDFNGVINQETIVSVIDSNGNDASNCICVTSEIVDSPKPRPPQSDCGCDFEVDDKILKIDYTCYCEPITEPCDYKTYTLDKHGIITFYFDTFDTTLLSAFPHATLDEAILCCERLGYEAIKGYGGIKEFQCVLPQQSCRLRYVVTVTDAYGSMSNGKIEVQLNGGVPVFDYSLVNSVSGIIINDSTSNTTLVLDNLPSDSYTLSITDGNGCYWREIIMINSTECNLNMNINTTAPNYNVNDGTITVTILQGEPDYEFILYLNGSVITQGVTSDNPLQINGLGPGDYTLRIDDANSCVVTEVFTLVESLPPCNMSFDLTTGNESIIINNVTGTPPFNYYLDNSLITTLSDSNFTFTNVSVGVHDVKVSDNNGCSLIKTINVNKSYSQSSCPTIIEPILFRMKEEHSIQSERLFYTIDSAVALNGYDYKTYDIASFDPITHTGYGTLTYSGVNVHDEILEFTSSVSYSGFMIELSNNCDDYKYRYYYDTRGGFSTNTYSQPVLIATEII